MDTNVIILFCNNADYFQKYNKNILLQNIFLCISFLVPCMMKQEMKIETVMNLVNKEYVTKWYINNLLSMSTKSI